MLPLYLHFNQKSDYDDDDDGDDDDDDDDAIRRLISKGFNEVIMNFLQGIPFLQKHFMTAQLIWISFQFVHSKYIGPRTFLSYLFEQNVNLPLTKTAI